MNKYEKLFTPIRIGNRILKNRIEAAPAALSNLTPEGYFTDQNIATFERKAKGGPAIVNMGEARIDLKTGISHKLCLALDDDGVLPSLLMATDAIKRHNAIPAVELIHPGGRTNPEYYDGTIWAPSAHKGHLGKDYTELDEETINYIVERFGDAAEMAMYGGVEMIMIHGGHGWLIHEFLSPLHNQRTDKFGGSLENRARFALMVIENIRKKCPNLIIEFRMSGTEYVEGGLTIEDQVEFAKLIDGKVDLIHVSSGSFHYPETNQKMFPNMFMPHGCNVQYSEKQLSKITLGLNIALLVVGVTLALNAGSILDVLNAFYAFLAAACFIPFFGGLLWKKGSAKGAIAASVAGIIVVVLGWLGVSLPSLGGFFPCIPSAIAFVIVSLIAPDKAKT